MTAAQMRTSLIQHDRHGPFKAPAPTKRLPLPLLDSHFARLLGRRWRLLPAAVQRRFSHQPRGEGCTVYHGRVLRTHLSLGGWLLAQAARCIGAPLPLQSQTDRRSVVVISQQNDGRGQLWMRQYARRRGMPQIICSAKRFAGPTGLEEHIGAGVGMALRVEAMPDRLRFLSAHFFVQAWRWRWRIPARLLPIEVAVEHIDLSARQFVFVLRVQHGRRCLIQQYAIYRES